MNPIPIRNLLDPNFHNFLDINLIVDFKINHHIINNPFLQIFNLPDLNLNLLLINHNITTLDLNHFDYPFLNFFYIKII